MTRLFAKHLTRKLHQPGGVASRWNRFLLGRCGISVVFLASAAAAWSQISISYPEYWFWATNPLAYVQSPDTAPIDPVACYLSVDVSGSNQVAGATWHKDAGTVDIQAGVNVDTGDGSDGDLAEPITLFDHEVKHYRQVAPTGTQPLVIYIEGEVTIRCQMIFMPTEIRAVIGSGKPVPRLTVYAGQALCRSKESFGESMVAWEYSNPPIDNLWKSEAMPRMHGRQPRAVYLVSSNAITTVRLPGGEFAFMTTQNGGIQGSIAASGAPALNGGENGGKGGAVSLFANQHDVNVGIGCRGGNGGTNGGQGGNGGVIAITAKGLRGSLDARGGAGGAGTPGNETSLNGGSGGSGGNGGLVNLSVDYIVASAASSIDLACDLRGGQGGKGGWCPYQATTPSTMPAGSKGGKGGDGGNGGAGGYVNAPLNARVLVYADGGDAGDGAMAGRGADGSVTTNSQGQRVVGPRGRGGDGGNGGNGGDAWMNGTPGSGGIGGAKGSDGGGAPPTEQEAHNGTNGNGGCNISTAPTSLPQTTAHSADEWTIMLYFDAADSVTEWRALREIEFLEHLNLSKTGVNVLVCLARSASEDRTGYANDTEFVWQSSVPSDAEWGNWISARMGWVSHHQEGRWCQMLDNWTYHSCLMPITSWPSSPT